jgi:hypothetical protein
MVDASKIYFDMMGQYPDNKDEAWQNKAGLLAKANKFNEAIEYYTNTLADLSKAVSIGPSKIQRRQSCRF